MTVSDDRRVAIIGMALRFPGADTPEKFWRSISDGVCHVRRFTESELAQAGTPREARRDPEFVAASALLPDIDRFDAECFGMSGREAELTDPQHRMFLECCHHALEDAGYAGGHGAARIGVIASGGYHLYSLQTYLQNNVLSGSRDDDWVSGLQQVIGNCADFIATRAAFRLGLTGPALSVQSACSSSLTGVHLAVQSLLAGDADVSVVGASAVHVPQILGYRYVKGSIISRTGRCVAFDAASDGTVGGNGVAAVVLKPLAQAQADGDQIHGVILGSGVTNDGASKQHFTEPSVAGQREAISRALRAAAVSAETIGYVEAHGTGTFKGDPIELTALAEAFAEHTDSRHFCGIGSVKANIGHLDACSGLAGLIKAVLVLRHGVIPPLAGFTAPNPTLELESSPFYLPSQARRWADGGPRRAGVTSLGMGGTNVHVVLEQAPEGTARSGSGTSGLTAPGSPATLTPPGLALPGLAPLSGASEAALRANARALRDHLRERPDTAMADLVTTLALGRRLQRHRLVACGDTPAEVVEAIDAYLGGSENNLTERGRAVPATRLAHTAAATAPIRGSTSPRHTHGVASGASPARLAWVCSGQGSVRSGMANALYHRFAVVRQTLDACDRQHREERQSSLLQRMLSSRPSRAGDRSEADEEVWRTETGQAALFALQVAQLRLWGQVLSDEPAMVAGHSVGEYAALVAAGALSLEDGLRLTAVRGHLMRHRMPSGGMLSTSADPETVRQATAKIPGLELAVINGARRHVLAGPQKAMADAARHLNERGLSWQPLAVSRAFHTSSVESILDELAAACASVEFRPTQTPFVSGVDGAVMPAGWTPDSGYLLAQSRRTVRFDRVLDALRTAGCAALLELGPDRTLSGLARRELPGLPALPTQHPGVELDVLWQTVARLHTSGSNVNWATLAAGCGGGRISLPGYRFQRKTYWIGPTLVTPAPETAAGKTSPDEERLSTDEERRSIDEERKETAVDQTLGRILELTATRLGFSEADVAGDVSFFDLGADSLQMINMLRELERDFQVKIAMRELFEQASTPQLLAELVASRVGAPQSPEAVAPQAPRQAPGPSTANVPTPWSVPPVDAAAAASPPGHGTGAPGGPYATREAVEDLARQVQQLAQVQVQLMTALSQVLSQQLAGGNGRPPHRGEAGPGHAGDGGTGHDGEAGR